MENVKSKFVRDGRVLDANGKDLGPVEEAAGEQTQGESQEAQQPTLKTGDLPANFVGIGKLKEVGLTTYEALRGAEKADLTSAGLSEEQAEKALAAAKAPVKAD